VSVSAGETRRPLEYRPHVELDTGGFAAMLASLEPWARYSSLEQVAAAFDRPGLKALPRMDRNIAAARAKGDLSSLHMMIAMKAMLYNSDGETKQSYEVLSQLRATVERDDRLAREFLYSIIYFQGVDALRRGENENCIECTGESSCILPIAESAVHANPAGSRLAIHHFSEYLAQFPDDLEVRWLLNLAHMTLGEHPDRVDPRFLISLDRFQKSEFDIGKFQDVGHLVGVNRLSQAGCGIMDDFDNDGLLDLVVTSMDPTQAMIVYRNKGDGTFEDRSKQARVTDQLGGGLVCYQGDYNNDGFLDVFVPRGAWLPYPIRPSLLRNNGDWTFTDVTEQAGLLEPVNSNSASWGDYDNDGWLDLFVCCEKQPNLLYHNRGDGTFEEVSGHSGLRSGRGAVAFCKGSTWIDVDNDDDLDLFVNNMAGYGELYLNHKGAFTNASGQIGIDGPSHGFSCWAWDYDNDGWLDIFATSYDRTTADVVRGILGQPHRSASNRLFHNRKGTGFEDLTSKAGLDMVFATMGSNYGDLDNDGFLDMYLGTGDPSFSTLVPNRMFKNVGGVRFAEITGTSGTGHLQKGHGVACGDWDRDGDLDIFIDMGGAVNGDKYHDILFQNPGQGNHWLTLKLVGKQTNRAAIGARIKVVTSGPSSQTIHRHVSSGSSFGANPLEQTIGLGKAERISTLEIHWPTSGTTQVFRDVAVNQAIEVTEFASQYRQLKCKPIALPE
jgi:hypothetical protein